MMERCYRSSNTSYKHYGARGIKVCERWHDFTNFLADMGERPDGMTIDRKDNNDNYYPANCRWLLATKQACNRRSSVYWTHDGRTQCIAEWAHEIGLSIQALWTRVNKYGWSVERALTTNKMKCKRKYAPGLPY